MTYTHKYRPWVLAASYKINGTRADAMRLERYIKKQKSRQVIERLVSEEWYFTHLAQLV